MNDSSSPSMNAVFRERLQQAVRVMQGLVERGQEQTFDVGYYVGVRDDGTQVHCIAGHCGLDPWFQERGLITLMPSKDVTVMPGEFFGTNQPFHPEYYGAAEDSSRVTVDDAIEALKRAIDARSDDPAPPATVPI